MIEYYSVLLIEKKGILFCSLTILRSLVQEMDAATFKEFSSHEWHIGVVSVPNMLSRSLLDSLLVQ